MEMLVVSWVDGRVISIFSNSLKYDDSLETDDDCEPDNPKRSPTKRIKVTYFFDDQRPLRD